MTVSNTHSIGKMKHRNQHETVFKSVKIVRKTWSLQWSTWTNSPSTSFLVFPARLTSLSCLLHALFFSFSFFLCKTSFLPNSFPPLQALFLSLVLHRPLTGNLPQTTPIATSSPCNQHTPLVCNQHKTLLSLLNGFRIYPTNTCPSPIAPQPNHPFP